LRFSSIFFILLLLCGSVQVVTATQSYIGTKTWGSAGLLAGQFSSPDGVAMDASGNVYVVDTNNNRYQEFTKTGVYKDLWGGVGSGYGQFFNPRGIAVSSAGTVYMADTGNYQVQMIPSEGDPIKWGIKGSQDGQFLSPCGIAVDSTGNVYVADTGNNRIQKFTSTGRYLTQWNSTGSEAGTLSAPHGVAVDRYGYVYVVDTGNNRIQKFDLAGKYITCWGSSGSGDGQFNHPSGIAVDKGGSVYVADTGNNRIQKFTSSGDLITSWYGSDSGAGLLKSPSGIAVDMNDLDGAVYVTDTGNNRIQRFDSSPITLTFNPSAKSLVWGDQQQSFDLILSDVMNGLSGYEVTVSVDDPSILEIVGAQPPDWASTFNNISSLPSQTVTISGADTLDQLRGSSISTLSLGKLTIHTKQTGTTTLRITQYLLNDDSGNQVLVATSSAAITVDNKLVRPLQGDINQPEDTDHDGLYEDLNGNGVFDYNDVVLFFSQIDWITDNEPTVAFDFNRNGRVDFGDVVTLFNMM
jgi:tripartite motif-containing protein 71